MSKAGSVAPKERINIKYTPATEGQVDEVELPLKLLVTGDFKGSPEELSLEERKTVSIDKHNFDAVMKQSDLSIEIAVPNRLEENAEDQDIGVNLKIESMSDFSPDSIAKQVPQLNKLLELREALLALKGPMGNIPAFRHKLQELIADPNAREALEKELAIILEKE
ncbi:type VI secretion system contractile sheath small subunit [Rodentibacter sp. Ppn85]|uniref:type VI secretion system contractile sheath small subunit n=1 Tax=Rodentibacter sp. Ppn85 TaxID=1908525 RepID=UPI0009875A39|nr:type VI secretion system contractile sheath small subunit [Rodentibacter sp. Ppn85]OOF66683.1 type VI secretion system-associated protein [Rodentibacter sp. Ppn85]